MTARDEISFTPQAILAGLFLIVFLTLTTWPLLNPGPHGLAVINPQGIKPLAIVGSCTTLAAADTYQLNGSIGSADTCMTISADNVILDCQGHTIAYSNNGGNNEYGITTSGTAANLQIKNCIIESAAAAAGSSRFGIFLTTGASNGTIINNTIIAKGTGIRQYGINVGVGSHNVTNNTIRTNGSNDNYGIYVQTASNTLHRNTIFTNSNAVTGTSQNHGIFLASFATDNNIITDNRIFTNGSGSANFGILLRGDFNLIDSNRIQTDGNSSTIGRNHGVSTDEGADARNNNITNNNITTNSLDVGNNRGVNIRGTGFPSNRDADNNLVQNNNIYTNSEGDGSNYGVSVSDVGGSDHNKVIANTIRTHSATGDANYGILISNTPFSTVTGNNITSNGTIGVSHVGIYIEGTSTDTNVTDNIIVAEGNPTSYGIVDTLGGAGRNNRYINNTITAIEAPAIRLSDGSGSLYENNTLLQNLNDTVDWIDSASGTNTFNLTTFATQHGSIKILDSFTVSGVDTILRTEVNISNNNAFINSTAESRLNTTSTVTLSNIISSTPAVDFEDDGTFVPCNAPQCTNVVFANNVLTYDVSSFTTYSSIFGDINFTLTKTDSADPVDPGDQLNYTITLSVNGSIFNASIVETYPDSVAFENSTPAPDIGNNTFILGNISDTNITITITVNISTNAVDDLNNTINLTFANGTGQTNSTIISEITNLTLPPAPKRVDTGGGGGGGSNTPICPPSCLSLYKASKERFKQSPYCMQACPGKTIQEPAPEPATPAPTPPAPTPQPAEQEPTPDVATAPTPTQTAPPEPEPVQAQPTPPPHVTTPPQYYGLAVFLSLFIIAVLSAFIYHYWPN